MNKHKLYQQYIQSALNTALRHIAHLAGANRIAAGLSSEGYLGGYADALMDVQLLLNDVVPHRRDLWDEARTITSIKREKRDPY